VTPAEQAQHEALEYFAEWRLLIEEAQMKVDQMRLEYAQCIRDYTVTRKLRRSRETSRS